MLCLAGVPEEVAILLVGHANVQMIHEVYLSLKPKMITDAGTKLNNLLNPVHIRVFKTVFLSFLQSVIKQINPA
ncbi:MAG: hypothetical protein K0Q85_933 [Caproiciproducens sp.]|jgi:hypothetical protein|nr:hypothetical protein [Caproiciproducens sp.]